MFGRMRAAMNTAPSLAAATELAQGDYEQEVTVDGRSRWYSVHIPAGYDKAKPAPLVLNFHGGGGNPTQQRHDSCLDETADRNGFIVVYPAGTGMFPRRLLTYNGGICCGYAKNNNVDDVGFTKAVLADVARFVPYDAKRVYASGFSNGGFLCYRLACEMPGPFAAIAVVSAVQGIGFDAHRDGPPVPLMHIHGLLDHNVNYHGGVGENAMEKTERPSVAETLQYWLARNRCRKEAFEETRKGAAVCRRFKPDAGGAPVVLWTMENGGHTWPGGRSTLPESMVGPINQDVSASELIWDFFKEIRS